MEFIDTSKPHVVEGDCLEFMKKIPDQSIDFICSDPPYNISGKGGTTLSSTKGVIPADFGEWDKWETEDDYFNFIYKVCDEYKRILKANANLILFLSYYTGGHLVYELNERNIFSFRGPIILVKENPIPQFKENGFRPCFEMAFWLVNNKGTGSHRPKTFHFLSQEKMKNVMTYGIGPKYKLSKHPTEKPEHIISDFIKIFTNEGDVVLDSFAGSGTTPAACQKINRRFIAIERENRFFRMMKKRLRL